MSSYTDRSAPVPWREWHDVYSDKHLAEQLVGGTACFLFTAGESLDASTWLQQDMARYAQLQAAYDAHPLTLEMATEREAAA